MAIRIESVALLDDRGRSIEFNQRRARLLTEPFLRRPRRIPALLIGTGSFRAIFPLLQAWIRTQPRGGQNSSDGLKTVSVDRAKARFLSELLRLDFTQARIRGRGSIYRFDIRNKELVWQLLQVFSEIVESNEYNVMPENVGGKVVMDVGAHVGVFSFFAARMGAARVLAFEPVKATYRMLQRNIEANSLSSVVLPFNKALGERAGIGRVSYLFEGDWASSLEANSGIDCMEEECEVSTIDETAADQKIVPDFIKIDAEGYEMKIILGARKTIGTSRPLPSIAAYHKKDDVEELSRTVLSVRNDYRRLLLGPHHSVLHFY